MFGWLDVGILLLVLFFVLIGMWRGLVGSLVKLLGGVVRFVLAVLLTKPIVKLISLTSLNEQMFGKLTIKYSGISDKFNVNLVGMGESELNTFVREALADAKIPRIFRGMLQNFFGVSPELIATKESVTLAELMGVAVGNIILLAITFVVLFVVFWLFSKLAAKWSIKHSRKHTVFAKANKWLGGAFGFVRALIVLFIVFVGISILSNFNFMSGVVDTVNSSLVGNFLYRVSNGLIKSSFDIKSFVESWLRS